MIKFSLFCTALLMVGASVAAPAEYPTRPIRLIVNSAPAGPVDICARAIATYAGKLLGQTVIVENRPGAAGIIGAKVVAKSVPDGHTLLMTLDTLLTVNPYLYKRLANDVIPHLEPLSIAGSFGLALTVRSELGVDTVHDLLRYARSHPITYSSAGYGSPGNLAFEKFKQITGIDATHVPFGGSPGAINALLGDQIQAGFLSASAVQPHIKAGKFRALAISSRELDPDLPGVPVMAQLGLEPLKDFEAAFAFLVMAPRGMSRDIAAKWDETLAQVYASPEFQASIASLGMRAPFSGHAVAKEWVQTQAGSWAEVIESAGIKGE
jgi:tripartite-type tricarboxylate transporter receptor subunit TctC